MPKSQGRNVICHSVSFSPRLFQYIYDQSQAKKRSFSAEARDLLEYGVSTRDGEPGQTAIKEAASTYVKQPQQCKPKPTKAPE